MHVWSRDNTILRIGVRLAKMVILDQLNLEQVPMNSVCAWAREIFVLRQIFDGESKKRGPLAIWDTPIRKT